ncbi:MFS family permease [Catenulispora sp. EB89]
MQTPRVAGYGFGLSTFTAGLFLVPFSVVGFVAGRLSPQLRKHLSAPALVTAATAVVIAAFALFAVARGTIAGPLVSMTLLGLGVGAFSAAMPAVILEVTPAQETASAMGVNQVVRSIGFSLGSTLSALLLAAHTPTGALFPADGGFTTTAWIGAAITALALGISFTLRPRAAATTAP